MANKPLLYYAVESLVDCGITEIAVNFNPGQLEEIQAYLGLGKKWGIKFTYILQKEPKGLANILYCCRDFIGKDKFVMHLGDSIFHGGIKPLVKRFQRSKKNGLLTMIEHPENLRMGVPFFDKAGRLKKYIEKPKKAPHHWAVPCLYFADGNIFECFEGKDAIAPSARGEYEIPSAFQWLIDHQFTVEVFEFKGTWLDPGKFDDWIETNRFLLDSDLKKGNESKLGKNSKIEGRVKIGKKCRIENSTLRGPLVIGDGVIIKNSFIGPYSSIGDECRIHCSKVENSILMPKVEVNNLRDPLESSLIGRETFIEGSGRPFNCLELFVGNQCRLKI